MYLYNILDEKQDQDAPTNGQGTWIENVTLHFLWVVCTLWVV